MALVLPSSISNPTTGQAILTSWGDGVNDAFTYLGSTRPRCVVHSSAGQSVANATATDLTANVEDIDVGGMHSTVTNTARITVPAGEGGLYRIGCALSTDADADGYRRIVFMKNGSGGADVVGVPSAGGVIGTVLSGSRLIPLVAGDYVTCQFTHTAGAALNVYLWEFSAFWEAT